MALIECFHPCRMSVVASGYRLGRGRAGQAWFRKKRLALRYAAHVQARYFPSSSSAVRTKQTFQFPVPRLDIVTFIGGYLGYQPSGDGQTAFGYLTF